MNEVYLQHLTSSKALETTYEARRAGFVTLALEKNRRATPYVEEAKALKIAVSAAKTPTDLRHIPHIQSALLTASGLSDKALNHLSAQDKEEAINHLINKYLLPAGEKFVEELVFRFLLVRGDTLGGSMRNAGGFLAQCKLIRAIISSLKLSGSPYSWLHAQTNIWIEMPDSDADIELFIRGLHWQHNNHPRTLLFNLNVPIVGNNIDLSLFDQNTDKFSSKKLTKGILNSPEYYIALGELKGGIDPAGADEHWKTARTAFQRIRESFTAKGHRPHLFFVGAAIETKMAVEIWQQLENGTLTNAANLTDEAQLIAISRWLCSL